MPWRYRPLTTGKQSRAATEAAIRFLVDLWDYEPRAYTFIATRRGDRWRDHAIRGDRGAKLAAIIAAHPADRFDIYFCPNAFAGPHRRMALALPSRCAWCDIDDADPDAYDPQPNILWATSPGRFQGIWLWREVSPGDIAEQISRNIWAKDGGDKGGWSVTKMLRLPGTINHKPQYR
ncbi:DNA-primase RepB domain-containing protein, partial [Sphingomonas sp.]|uniref:DNA-primase RepB domain-containing protein n=1 Tax=Sphingomonas sp. TaxID=28214 RepID=UPI002BABAB09